MLTIDAQGLVDLVVQRAVEECGLPVLRTYWYDGAKDGIPSTQHQVVAGLPNVKLRLGRINAQGQQKGVDALIYRDIMTLARERAISDAYLLSGDEDLREGVRAAQDMGVRVGLIGITTQPGRFNQSRDLKHEADTVETLTAGDLRALFRKGPRRQLTTDEPEELVERLAAKFGSDWVSDSGDEEWRSLRAVNPRIPKNLDVDLLLAIEEGLGMSLRGSEHLRQSARASFWRQIMAGDAGDDKAG